MYKILLLLLKFFGSHGFPKDATTSAAAASMPFAAVNDANSSHPFICTDGTRLELSKVCNGYSDCPDSSDELRRLCHHVLCPASNYRCSYGACVAKTGRCDGLQDCIDGSDEFLCDVEEICTDREYRCFESTECVPLRKICNGYADCPDGSDESETLCRDYPCPPYAHHCAYGGCINPETICDGAKDCADGSDEETSLCASINCQGSSDCLAHSCKEDEFRCESGQCIPATKVCDGTHQCRDLSDEQPEICASKKCNEGFFRCNYGGCIVETLKCNFEANCHDWSDEDESLCGNGFLLVAAGAGAADGACRLPPAKPATHYRVSNCPAADLCRPGQIVPELTRLDYTCHHSTNNTDGFLEGSRTVYCQDNHWSPKLPFCLSDGGEPVTCPTVEAPGAMKQCQVLWGARQGWIDCNVTSFPIGTRVKLECPEFYERETGASQVICLHDGTWSQLPLHCRPICGIRSTTASTGDDVAALVIKGWELNGDGVVVEAAEAAAALLFPWHATLFSHDDGRWNFFCGGTLISERAVLTAGHCVWKSNVETIRVVLAGFSSDYTKRTNLTQTIRVKRIELQYAYQDHEGNYGSDLAILILDTVPTINDLVKPVCLGINPRDDDDDDFLDRSSLSLMGETSSSAPLKIGLVPGMGITENDTFSEKLRVTSVKLVPDDQCRESMNRDFRKYVTYTSFCAGWLNGSAVCNGDSGGGLVINRPHSQSIWDIHGVVSISPRRIGTSICDPNYYTVFTKVSTYRDWIFDILMTLPIIGPQNEQYEQPPNKDITEV